MRILICRQCSMGTKKRRFYGVLQGSEVDAGVEADLGDEVGDVADHDHRALVLVDALAMTGRCEVDVVGRSSRMRSPDASARGCESQETFFLRRVRDLGRKRLAVEQEAGGDRAEVVFALLRHHAVRKS